MNINHVTENVRIRYFTEVRRA